jgi:hypothetical protein
MGFGDTLKSIGENFVEGFGSFFGVDAGDAKYPTEGLGRDISKITNRPEFNNGAWRKSLGYAFKVVRVKDEVANDDTAKGWKEFLLQINPQELSQDEIFAIEVTPTFRGVLVEHHGITLKDITISGTTGISPGRREGGAFSKTGAPILAAGQSGYEEFNELRSYFRVYVEQKRIDDQKNGELRMVFRNFKDEEDLYIEPQKFTMKRSAGRPFMYDYTIQMKAVGVAALSPDPFSIFDIFDKAVDIVNDVSDILNDSANVIAGGVGLIQRTERDVTRTVLGPLRAINNVLDEFKKGSVTNFGTKGITRRFLAAYDREIERIEANFNDALGRDMDSYNTAVGRVSNVRGAAGRQSTYDELQILNSFGNIKRSVNRLLTQDSLFVGDVNADKTKVEDEYAGKITIADANSVRSVRISGNDNIQTIASRELGDPDAFRDLVITNNLKPPYIDPAGGPGVLRPGDEILIPQLSASSDLGVIKLKEFAITKFLSESEKNLGVDIRLTDQGDLASNNTSDLDLIAGLTNMSQALALRIELEQGSLKRQPQIGTSVALGEKVPTRTLVNLRLELLRSIGSDSRVEAIPFIELSQEGGTTTANMVVKLKNLSQPIPIPLKLIS